MAAIGLFIGGILFSIAGLINAVSHGNIAITAMFISVGMMMVFIGNAMLMLNKRR